MKKISETTTNFYIAAPNSFTDNIIAFNGKKFNHCKLKCGEAIGQTVEARLAQEVKNAGGMCCVFQFYIPTDIIAKKESGFDHTLFGHQKIVTDSETTIWKFCHCFPKKVPQSKEFGKEFMDLAPFVNEWLKEDKDDYKDIIKNINASEAGTQQKNNKILYLLKILFESHFPEIVDKYIKSKSGSVEPTKVLKLYDHQHKILVWLMENINKGKRNIVAQLPCRFGKTLTFLKLFAEDEGRKLLIVTAYTGNVGASYYKEIRLYNDFKDVQIVDANEDFKDWKYDGKKAIILFPTTGDMNTIQRRVSYIKNLKSKMKISASEIEILDEEADYGNHTEDSNEKFSSLMKAIDNNKESLVIHTTGTEAYKATKLSAFGDFDAQIIVNHNDWNQLFV